MLTAPPRAPPEKVQQNNYQTSAAASNITAGSSTIFSTYPRVEAPSLSSNFEDPSNSPTRCWPNPCVVRLFFTSKRRRSGWKVSPPASRPTCGAAPPRRSPRLKQIALNLLSNAVKFTPAGDSVTVADACRATSSYAASPTAASVSPRKRSPSSADFEQVESQSVKASGLWWGSLSPSRWWVARLHAHPLAARPRQWWWCGCRSSRSTRCRKRKRLKALS